EGVEVHAEDRERRVISAYLNPPSDRALALGFLEPGRSVIDPIDIGGRDNHDPVNPV
ncbi:hypothetical protein KI387_027145, partial [Taxus chinensis]